MLAGQIVVAFNVSPGDPVKAAIISVLETIENLTVQKFSRVACTLNLLNKDSAWALS